MKLLRTTVVFIIFGLSQLSQSSAAYIDPGSFVFPDASRALDQTVDEADTNDPRPAPEVTNEDTSNFLQDLGFYNPAEVADRLDMLAEDPVKEALRKFQQRYNLSDTGILDDDTRRLIAAPRCGLPAELNDGEKWSKKTITYMINSLPRSLDSSVARQTIRQAFDEWTKYADLNIREINQGQADIYISDEGRIHSNRLGGECRFDRDTTVAHAYFPEIGDIHYNGARSYTEDEFFSANLHEMGHTLGLDHTTSQSSIMFPMHIRYHSTIPTEDQISLQSLYGPRINTVIETTTRRPVTTSKPAPKLCSINKIDTIFNDAQGNTIIFAGEYYFESDDWNPRGRLISSRWSGLPSNIDASFTYHRNGKTFFFKGTKLWVYADNQLEAGYPKAISQELPGLPNHMDAAYVTKGGSIVALRNKHYWFYNPKLRPQVSSHFPRLVYDFKNMPTNIDAAMRHTDGKFYFFKGRYYYTLNLSSFTVSEAMPLEDMWLLC
ncbi:matrix metalloproteinase-19-like [Uranotaenia lowii]|uniref:matrix metalloproteinase-19-like n=1 Tax=Uranotaenia lowii TaxID=190385 RepID=UPI00247A3E8F|nr:matrix metalloproteinase-19-like [Uranotaenia lowii]